MDIVLGVSMAPTSVRMLLVEGENADGVTVEDNEFDIATDEDAATLSAADQVISAILGTHEGATEAGHALTSTGVTWTDPVDAAALHEALATRKIENVMLVSAFMAAAALAQTVGNTVGDHHTALLFLEPDTATLAIIDSADGAISDVHKELIPGDSVAELAGMLAGLDELETSPQSVFIVGTGVDVAAIKPQLETLTALPVTAAEEPESALAWGAALASANAPLFASSTAALAYAQDPGTGAVDPHALPEYLAGPYLSAGNDFGDDEFAYSLVADDDADAPTVVINTIQPRRKPVLLLGSAAAVVAISAVVALEIALAIGIRTTVALQPSPNESLIVPAQPAPAPPVIEASAPRPKISLPAPMAAPRPLNPLPVAEVPAAPLPAAPVVPVPVVAPPVLPVPAPAIHLPIPDQLLSPPMVQAPMRLSPPQQVVAQPPVHVPQQPVHQTPPNEGMFPNPSLGGGHDTVPGSGPFGGGGEPGGSGPFGGGGHEPFGGG